MSLFDVSLTPFSMQRSTAHQKVSDMTSALESKKDYLNALFLRK